MSRLERTVVALVILHTVGVGVVLLFAPDLVLAVGGFERGPTFFVRQGGAFHLVAAAAYAAEYRRLGTVRLLVGTKAWATVFLGSTWLLGETAWAVPFSAAADGAMGVIVWWVHHRAREQAAAVPVP